MPAKIEICTRDVLGVKWIRDALNKYVPGQLAPHLFQIAQDAKDSDPQHLFILFTRENGEKIILRGGPEFGRETYDNIRAVVLPYILANADKFPNDYSDNPIAKTIFTGTNAQMQVYLDRAITYAQFINQGKYDYKLPIGTGSVQNSNTVVKLVTEFMELPLALPKDPDSRFIWVPGIEVKGLDHSATDYIFAEIKDRYENFRTPALVDPNAQRTGEKFDTNANFNGMPTWKVTQMSTGKFLHINPSNGQVFYEGTLNAAGQEIGAPAYYLSAADMSIAATNAMHNMASSMNHNIMNHMQAENVHPNAPIDFGSSVVTGHNGNEAVQEEQPITVKPLEVLGTKELNWDSQGVPYYEYKDSSL